MQAYPDTIQDMIDDFAFLGDWEERYMHVIDMGKSMPPLSPEEKTDIHKVKGCVSQVWLVSDVQDGKLIFRGDSDAHIVKGPQRSNGLKAMIERIQSQARALSNS